METPPRVSKPPRVPRYVRDLNQLAEVRGIATSILLGPGDNNPEIIHLWAKWTGACHQLQSLGLLARHQLARLTWSSPRLRRLTFTVPSSEPQWCDPLLHCEMQVTGDQFEWRLDFGPVAVSVADRSWGDVEAVTHVNGI